MTDEAANFEPGPVDAPEETTDEVAFSDSKSVEEVAKEVVAGLWSRGNRRKNKLKAAGFDPSEVEEAVSKIFNR